MRCAYWVCVDHHFGEVIFYSGVFSPTFSKTITNYSLSVLVVVVRKMANGKTFSRRRSWEVVGLAGGFASRHDISEP